MTVRPVLFLSLLLSAKFSFAEIPADLPGEEITQDYIHSAAPNDSINRLPTDTTKAAVSWSEKIEKTWDAPPLAEQLAADPTTVPLGKGGIFIPRFTDRGNEPDIEIVDPEGITIGTARPGITASVEPGVYFLMLGSGSHHQRIVRKVTVEESQTVSVFPDWTGLTVETIDTNSTPFRGEYELIRIDEFEPYGRGYGADPNTGEAVNGWILKAGTYKILGRGESYNTLRNFITVRLLPGELVKVILVENPDNLTIVSGGTIELTSGKRITSNWKYGANIGGTVQLNAEIDRREAQQEPLNSLVSLRTNIWLNYRKNPMEWESSLRVDEGINLSGKDFSNLTSGDDKLDLHSVFIWRLLPWLGPYIRGEIKTNLLPKRISRDSKKKFFYLPDGDPTTNDFIQSQVYQITPSFSPFTFENGIGANFDALSTHLFDIKVKLGAGSSINSFPKRYKSIDFPGDSSFNDSIANSVVLIPEDSVIIKEIGPQGSISGTIVIGRLGTSTTELKVFAPVFPEMRLKRPDFDFSTILSWRVARPVTLDYEFTFQLKQPKNTDAQVKKSTHSIWLRFSYSSR